MTSTDLAPIEPSGFLALSSNITDVAAIIEENLGGGDMTERDLMRLTVPSGKVTVPRWEVPDIEGGSTTVDQIAGIIVYKRSTRQWWPRSIDEGGSGMPPSCQSPDAKVGFGKQWATAEDPDPDGDPRQQVCKLCPHAQFGSDGRGQACNQTEQIFLLAETGLLPIVISAPPMSLDPLKRYMIGLSNAGLRHTHVQTVLGLERARNAGGTDFVRITFRKGVNLTPETIAAASAYADALRPQFEAVSNEAADVPAAEPAADGAGQPPAETPPAPAAADEPEPQEAAAA